MSDQQPEPRPDRPVLNGLVALVAVALGVGLILALVALLGTRVLGLGDDDGSATSASTVRDSMYLPTPTKTEESSGPRITLNTESPEESESSSESGDPEESVSTEATESESASPGPDDISLQAVTSKVTADERIYFSGVYPAGEGAILWVERWEDGAWASFPASVGVTNGTFSSYIFTGQPGLNRFRVVDRDKGVMSNEIRVIVG